MATRPRSMLRGTVAFSALAAASSFVRPSASPLCSSSPSSSQNAFSLRPSKTTRTRAASSGTTRKRHRFDAFSYPSGGSSSTCLGGEISGGGGSSSTSDITDESASSSSLLSPEVLMETLIEPALATTTSSATSTSTTAAATTNTGDGHSDSVTLPDSDSMLTLATVQHPDPDEEDLLLEQRLDSGEGGGVVDASTLSMEGEKELQSQEVPTATLPNPIQAPTVSKIIKFAIPAMGVWLCGPILSMIDTSAVGLLSGTAQQAALNPAVSVTDYGGLLVAFMYTATTNLVASSSESDRYGDDGGLDGKPRTAQTLMAALQLALYVGVAFGLTLGVFSQSLLRALIGNDSLDPVVFAAANKYVKIRSLGMPAAVVIGSAQSACLGMQDIKSPLYVLLAAAIVNALGDAIFVGSSHPWIGGCAGAAWATVASQYAALGMFVAWLKSRPRSRRQQRRKGVVANSEEGEDVDSSRDEDGVGLKSGVSNLNSQKLDISSAIMELTTKSEEGKTRRKRFKRTVKSVNRGRFSLSRNWTDRRMGNNSKRRRKEKKKNDTTTTSSSTPSGPPPSRGVLSNRFRTIDLFKLPPLAAAREFWPFVIPVTTTAIGRISGYIAMSHVASSALGTIDMAAQAVIFSFFCCLTPICDSLNLTAQSFVPAIYEKKPSAARADALRHTLRNFSKVGGIFGAALVAMVATIPVLSQFFTTDLAVRTSVNLAIPGLSLFFALSGLVCVGEGILLGQKDLKFLGNAYGAYFFAVPYFLLRLKKRAIMGLQDVGVGTMWRTFSIYQAIRCCIWLARMKQLQGRTDRQVEEQVVSQVA